MANRLTDLEVKEGTLCEEPMNKRARVMLFKHDTSDTSSDGQADPTPAPPPDTHPADAPSRFRSLIAAFGKKLGLSAEDVQEVEKDYMGSYGEPTPAATFDEVMQEHEMRELMEEFMDCYGGFCESMNRIMADPTADKVGMLQSSLDEFAGAVKEKFSNFKTMTKAGRKISADRLKQMKAMFDLLNKIIREQEPDFMPTMKAAEGEPMPEKDVEKKEESTAAQVVTNTEDVLKSLPAEVRTMVEKAQADAKAAGEAAAIAKAEAEEAKAVAKAEQEKREQTEVAKRVEAEIPHIQLEPVEKNLLVWKLEKGQPLTVEEGQKLYVALKAANNQLKESNLFKEAGFTPATNAAGSAQEAIEKRAQEMVEKGLVKTVADGIAHVMKTDHKLAQQYREEQRKAA